ncbi:50S ribosomal protein L31 type B [Dissostichus eleginoides]|uniref:50S ribosomal protein L31 type B n=1 Tax=Dissostichus eleginoides TaxID=100907 RepID=A0AAD9FIJ1_DISEL|nr:50S ribosomal protein L31 type B [Dissostichus eleginoides]
MTFDASGSGRGPAGGGSPPPVTLGTLISGSCLEVQRYAESVVGSGVIRSAAESAVLFLESLLGQEHIYTVAMFLQMVIRFLAEGAASGLNVIAVYVAEILRVTGFDVALTLPRFTPEGRVFWVVKTVLALWLFGLIVTEKNATAETTAVRVGGLVLGCVLLTLLTSCSEKTCTVEQRLSTLEGRVKGVDKRKGD